MGLLFFKEETHSHFLGHEKILGSPTFIDDNRLKNAGKKLDLAQGYSLMAETKFSTCFEAIDVSESMDLSFKVEELAVTQTEIPAKSWVDSEKQRFFRTHTHNPNKAYLGLKLEKVHQLVIADTFSLNLTEYYQKVLNKGDWATFFSSCAPYFIKSRVDYAGMWGVISVTKGEEEKVKSFFNLLKMLLQSFYQLENLDPKKMIKIKQQLLQYQPTVRVSFFGHPHIKGETRIDNIFKLKKTINRALNSLSQKKSGHTESIEVLPYGVLRNFLEQTDRYRDSLDSQEQQQFLNNFFQRQTFHRNSEFMAYYSYILAQGHELYAKFKKCHKSLNENFSLTPQNKWMRFQNHKYPYDKQRTLALRKMHFHFSQAKLTEVREKIDQFLKQVRLCYSRLSDYKMSSQLYLEIESCEQQITIAPPVIERVKNYCPPELFESSGKTFEKSKR